MSVLFEKFEISECIKKDAYGGVYLANHIYLNRQIVLKVLDTSGQQNSEQLNRFKREARILASLDHPNIIRILDFGFSNNQAYLSFEYFESSSLRTVLANKDLEFAQKLMLFNQLIQGLDIAHRQGVIHRDLKPENILIDKENHLKIADFGLSIIQDEAKVTEKSSIVGTPAYMSPEQIRGESLTPQSDLFSLGIVAFELFFGTNPFAGKDINETINTIQTYDESILTAQIKTLQHPVKDALKRVLKRDANARGNTNELMALLQIEPSASVKKILHFRQILIAASIVLLVTVILVFWKPMFTPQKQSDSKSSLENENPVTDTVQLTENIQRTNSQIISQQIAPGVLYFEIQPAADILIDGKLIIENGQSGTFSLQPGEYFLSIKRAGFPSFQQTVFIKETEVTSIRVNLDSLYGFVACQVHPWGNVYIADRYIGQTPLLEKVKLEPGQYVLRVENPNYPVFRDSVRIRPGDTTQIRINLVTHSK